MLLSWTDKLWIITMLGRTFKSVNVCEIFTRCFEVWTNGMSTEKSFCDLRTRTSYRLSDVGIRIGMFGLCLSLNVRSAGLRCWIPWYLIGLQKIACIMTVISLKKFKFLKRSEKVNLSEAIVQTFNARLV